MGALKESKPISKSFLKGYLGAALWLSMDDDDQPLDANYSISDFADKALEFAIKDTNSFIEANEADLLEAGDDEFNGYNFWLTRNGHGSGFWDRDYGDVGDRLTKASEAFGETDLYVGDDGMLYFSR